MSISSSAVNLSNAATSEAEEMTAGALTEREYEAMLAVRHGYYHGGVHGGSIVALYDRGLVKDFCEIGGMVVTAAGAEALEAYNAARSDR